MTDTCATDVKTKNITLVLTHQCNLRCVYCYEQNKSPKTMPLETVLRIIDEELTMDDGTGEVEFDFFGGEPLLAFDVIKAAVEQTVSKTYNKDYIFFITTNGTTLTEDQKDWFRAHADHLQMGLSLDGTKEMHDANRCNSFDKIDLSFFKETYPSQDVKMTVSELTLLSLAAGVIFCHDQGFEVACNLAYGIDWDHPENRARFEEQLYLLTEYYLAHPEVKPSSLLEINRIKNLVLQQDKSFRHCGAGYAMKAYDCDGKCYPCQFFLPLSVGKEKAEQSLSIKFSNYELEGDQIDENCKECLLRNICPTCYGNNYAATGNVYRRDMRLCNMHKIQCRAIAYFAAKRFEAGQLTEFTKPEAAAILKAALSILQSIE